MHGHHYYANTCFFSHQFEACLALVDFIYLSILMHFLFELYNT